jgi:hypothetical protein
MQGYYFRLSAASYPVTVEKELVIRFKGIYQLPRFYFCQPFQSVEYTTMVLKFPTGLKVNHKLYNYKAEGKKTVVGNDEIWQWEASNIASILHEEHSGDWKYSVPSISFNMSKF